jgi:hypothetical protein
MALCHEERDYAMGFTRRDPNPPKPLPKPRCKHCGGVIDRDKLRAEIAKVDIPETAKRAAENAVFCCLTCAFEDFGGVPYEGVREPF